VFEVPTPARAARQRRNVGEYRVSEGMGALPAEEQPHLTVMCPVCSALIRVAEDQVGQEVRCPDCDTPVVVARPVEIKREKSRPAVPLEEYAFCEEVDPSAPGPRTADRTYVPVTCPVCRTFMQVPEDQVGQEIVCPDCREPMVVPPPVVAEKKEAVPAAEYGEYAVREDDELPCESPAAEETRFAFRCPLCDTLIRVGRDQAGEQMVCRDCHTLFVVPPPPAPKRKLDLQSRAGDVYDVGDSIEVPEYRPLIPPPRWRPRPGVESGVDRIKEAGRVRARPPRWTFFSGIFGFPAYRNSWPRWVGLSLGLMAPLLLGQLAVKLAMVPAGPWAGAIPWIASMVLCGLAFLLGLMWSVVAFVSCLSILRDTAYGCHDIENWPEAVFQDWVGEFFFLIGSLGVSVLPGLVIGRVLESAGIAGWPSVWISIVLVFPVSLLAMLETNSPLSPFSLPVWRSLLYAWWAWGLFYVETTVLIAALGGLGLLAAIYVPVMGMVLAAPLLVATLMIYFRLLGRLAWRCGEGAMRDKAATARPVRNDDQEEG